MSSNAVENSITRENISEDHIRVVLKYKAIQDSIKVKLQTSIASEISQEWNVDWRGRECGYCNEGLYQGDSDIHLFACGHPLHAVHAECYTSHREIRERENNLQPIPCPICRRVNSIRIISANMPEITASMDRENFIRQTATLISARELVPIERGHFFSERGAGSLLMGRARSYDESSFERCCAKLNRYLSCNGSCKKIQYFSLYWDMCCHYENYNNNDEICPDNYYDDDANCNKAIFNSLYIINYIPQVSPLLCYWGICKCLDPYWESSLPESCPCVSSRLACASLCYVPFCVLSSACPLTWWGTAYKCTEDCS